MGREVYKDVCLVFDYNMQCVRVCMRVKAGVKSWGGSQSWEWDIPTYNAQAMAKLR